MTELQILRAGIKQRTTREDVARILRHIGHPVNRDWKFSIRDERTPSASIRADGYLHDFGDGWGGDIVALLHEHKGQSLPEATRYVAACLGIEVAA